MKRSAAEQSWQPLEDIVPAEIFQGGGVGVGEADRGGTPGDPYPTHETEVGQLFRPGAPHLQPGASAASRPGCGRRSSSTSFYTSGCPATAELFRALLRAYLAQLGEGGEECWKSGQRRLRKKTSGNS